MPLRTHSCEQASGVNGTVSPYFDAVRAEEERALARAI